MKWVKLISFLGVLAMTAVLFFGFTQGNFFEDGGKLMENPWGIVSLVDLTQDSYFLLCGSSIENPESCRRSSG